MTVKKIIAARLKAARIAAGYKTAREFSTTNSIPITTYYQHETGERALTADFVILYTDRLDLYERWLLRGKGPAFIRPDREKEKILLKELQSSSIVEDAISSILPAISKHTIKNQEIVLIDIALLIEIFHALLIESAAGDLNMDTNELLEFGLLVYNDIITLSTDDENRKRMILLSVSSLKRGTKAGKANSKKQRKV